MVSRLLFILFALATLFRAAISVADVRLEVSPRSGDLDEQFILSVVAEFTDTADKPDLTPSPDFEAAYIGPQTSVSIVNGTVSKQSAYSYRLQPRRVGTLKSPAATIQVDGKLVTLNSIEVVVSASSTPAPQRVSGVTLRQTISPKSLFIGQQAGSVLELRTGINLIDPQFIDMAFDGFWTESIAENERSSQIISGDQWDILRFRKALYPLVSGELSIPARTLKARIREIRRNRNLPFDHFDPFDFDILDNFFGGGTLKDITIASNELTVSVKELPPPPPNFPRWGLQNIIVGETTLSLNVPPGDLNVGDSKSVELTVVSTGNLNPLKGAEIGIPSSLKMYEDAAETKTFESGGDLMQKKVFRVSLVALQPGEVEVPPIALGYYDTSENSYRIAQTQPIRFAVIGQSTQGQLAPQPTASVPVQNKPLSSSTTQFEPRSLSEVLGDYLSFSSVLLIAALLIAAILSYRAVAKILRSQRPRIELLKQLETAKDLSNLHQAFRSCCLDVLDARSTVRGTEPLRALLAYRLKDKALVFEIQSVLDELDSASYDRTAIFDLSQLRSRCVSVARKLTLVRL